MENIIPLKWMDEIEKSVALEVFFTLLYKRVVVELFLEMSGKVGAFWFQKR